MGRPAKEPKEKLTEVPCKVSYDVAEEIARLAEELDRSRSQIARKLISRGLAAYRRDGSLDEPIFREIAGGRKKSQINRIPTEDVDPLAVMKAISKKKGGNK